MFNNILVPVDLGHHERVGAMIESISRLAVNEQARLTLLHVVENIPGYIEAQIPDELVERAEEEIRSSMRKLRDQYVPARDAAMIIQRGHPAQVILSAAEKHEIDLIVIGSHKPGFADYLLGSVAGKVVRHATCSVLVIR